MYEKNSARFEHTEGNPAGNGQSVGENPATGPMDYLQTCYQNQPAPPHLCAYPSGCPYKRSWAMPGGTGAAASNDPLDSFTDHGASSSSQTAQGEKSPKKKRKGGKIALWIGGGLVSCVVLGFAVYGVMAVSGVFPQASTNVPISNQTGSSDSQLPNQGGQNGNQNGGFDPNNPYYISGEAIPDPALGSAEGNGNADEGNPDGSEQAPNGGNPDGNAFGGNQGVYTGYQIKS